LTLIALLAQTVAELPLRDLVARPVDISLMQRGRPGGASSSLRGSPVPCPAQPGTPAWRPAPPGARPGRHAATPGTPGRPRAGCPAARRGASLGDPYPSPHREW